MRVVYLLDLSSLQHCPDNCSQLFNIKIPRSPSTFEHRKQMLLYVRPIK